jgi:hypothetical protein
LTDYWPIVHPNLQGLQFVTIAQEQLMKRTQVSLETANAPLPLGVAMAYPDLQAQIDFNLHAGVSHSTSSTNSNSFLSLPGKDQVKVEHEQSSLPPPGGQ